jgi:hypothetical protein
MLITRDILNKALEDKVPLFHDGDYIDDDVLYDLFYAQPILKDLPNGKKGLRTLIPRSDRDILCAELNGYISHSPKDVFDKIYYTLRCKLCNKTFPVHITKGQIINRTFKISNHINITVNPDRYYLFTNALRELYNMKYGNVHNTYVCKSCVEKFVSDTMQEASEFLERKDKFDWFLFHKNSDDWKRKLFRIEEAHFRLDNGKEIEDGKIYRAANGDVWKDDKYNEREKREQEERNHQRKLEEIRRQQKQNEEAERERTRKANELFLASHQLNTPTQRYIDKFCNKDSDIDITDKEIQREALSPEDVNYEAIQKHNSKLYREYLQSPLWKIISSKVKWNANYRCEKCGSTKNLVTHHTSYEFKGIEFLAFHTLQCLCSKCHEKKHEK